MDVGACISAHHWQSGCQNPPVRLETAVTSPALLLLQ